MHCKEFLKLKYDKTYQEPSIDFTSEDYSCEINTDEFILLLLIF